MGDCFSKPSSPSEPQMPGLQAPFLLLSPLFSPPHTHALLPQALCICSSRTLVPNICQAPAFTLFKFLLRYHLPGDTSRTTFVRCCPCLSPPLFVLALRTVGHVTSCLWHLKLEKYRLYFVPSCNSRTWTCLAHSKGSVCIGCTNLHRV